MTRTPISKLKLFSSVNSSSSLDIDIEINGNLHCLWSYSSSSELETKRKVSKYSAFLSATPSLSHPQLPPLSPLLNRAVMVAITSIISLVKIQIKYPRVASMTWKHIFGGKSLIILSCFLPARRKWLQVREAFFLPLFLWSTHKIQLIWSHGTSVQIRLHRMFITSVHWINRWLLLAASAYPEIS